MRVETLALGGITRHDKARVSRVSARAFESGDLLRSDFTPRIFNTAKRYESSATQKSSSPAEPVSTAA